MITEDDSTVLAAPTRPDTSESSGKQKRSAKQSGLYRAVWRWHFYAGLFSIPIIVMLCLTGIVYLFKPQIETVLYGQLTHVTPGAQTLSYQTQLQAVTVAYPNASISSVTPPVSPSSPTVFEVTRKSAKNKLAGFARDYTVFVNPYTGHVIGHRDNSKDPVNIAVVLHGSLMTQRLLGSEAWGDRLIEIVASWSVLLLATGVFLWWPRGKRRSSLKGVLIPRTDEKKGSRTFWRDVHAVTGILFAFVTIFFLVTGMLWTGVAGKKYQTAATKLGATNAADASLRKGFSSTKIEDVNRSGPWATAQLPVPISGEPGSPLAHAGHHGVGLLQWDPKDGAPLDAVVSQAQDLGFTRGFAIFMPADETGSYSVANYPDIEGKPNQRVSKERYAFIDQYTAKPLGNISHAQMGIFGRSADLTIALHEGRQLGLWSQLAALTGALAVLVSCATSIVLWRKRKPHGLGAPPLVQRRRINLVLFVLALLLGILFPLLGITLLAVVVFESLIVHRVPRLARALGAG